MNKALSFTIILSIIVSCGCAAHGPRVNDPSSNNYNPNYPPTVQKVVYIPDDYEGDAPSYRCSDFAIFTPGSVWTDPEVYYQKAENAANNGDWSAKALLGQERRHSVKQICDDNLVVLGTLIFFSRNGSFTFSEGNFRFYFEDGTSALDHGVRVNMSDDPYDPVGTRRSSAQYHLKVSREQIKQGKKAVNVPFLFDREHYGKTVVRIEPAN